MLAFAKTDIGKVRETNEDSFICVPPLVAVADGMGGHVAGEIASRMAVDTLGKYIADHNGASDVELLLAQAIREASSLIFRLAQEKVECAGMGTTITAAYITAKTIVWGHVGDSRLYLVRDKELRQLSEDHSLIGELVRSGNITKEESLTHPQKNILTRAVGTDEQVRVDTGVTEWIAGDKLLLCSDGLTTMVRDEEILSVITSGAGGEAVLDKLMAMANRAGGLDNITAILVQLGDA
ncbi:MAG: Stp1/IreP family PP2C-type Ser/Thr phosphatase [Negativicutes bacterium]|nr:Stp1/IreP family PP2C-type Ser/Thr phosphatase [Negativicutes bacterium]